MYSFTFGIGKVLERCKQFNLIMNTIYIPLLIQCWLLQMRKLTLFDTIPTLTFDTSVYLFCCCLTS